MKIAYEPHPVTPERKKELRDAGFKIIDARFKPASALPSREDIAAMKKADLVDWLEGHGADTSGKVGELRDRLTSLMYLEA